MTIQDSPKQIALTADQLKGIKDKYANMAAAIVTEVPAPEPVIQEAPVAEPIQESIGQETPVLDTNMQSTDNMFDQNLFETVGPKPEEVPAEPVVSNEPQVNEQPIAPTNTDIAEELEQVTKELLDIYVKLDGIANRLAAEKVMNNNGVKLDNNTPVEQNIFSM